MTNSPHVKLNSSEIWRRRSVLLVAMLLVSVFWCGVLPWLAAQPKMRQQLNFLDDQGIDPSAMFYTELDVMDSILQKSKVR